MPQVIEVPSSVKVFFTGFIYGAGFTTGALVILLSVRALFHVGLCG